MKTKHLLMLAAAGAGYVAYRGAMAGGGPGGPIGIMLAGWKSITAGPPKILTAPPGVLPKP